MDSLNFPCKERPEEKTERYIIKGLKTCRSGKDDGMWRTSLEGDPDGGTSTLGTSFNGPSRRGESLVNFEVEIVTERFTHFLSFRTSWGSPRETFWMFHTWNILSLTMKPSHYYVSLGLTSLRRPEPLTWFGLSSYLTPESAGHDRPSTGVLTRFLVPDDETH